MIDQQKLQAQPNNSQLKPERAEVEITKVRLQSRGSRASRKFASMDEVVEVFGKLVKIEEREERARLMVRGNGHADLEFIIPLDREYKQCEDGSIYNATRGFQIEEFTQTLGKDLLEAPEILSVRAVPGVIASDGDLSRGAFLLDGSTNYFFLAIDWYDRHDLRKKGEAPTLKVDHESVHFCKRAIIKNSQQGYQELRGIDFYILSMNYLSSEFTPDQAAAMARRRIRIFENFFQSNAYYIPPKRTQIRSTTFPVFSKINSPTGIQLTDGTLLTAKEITQRVEWLFNYANDPVDYLGKFHRLASILEKLGGHEVKSKKNTLKKYRVAVPCGNNDKQEIQEFDTNEFGYNEYTLFLLDRIERYYQIAQEDRERSELLMDCTKKLAAEREAEIRRKLMNRHS